MSHANHGILEADRVEQDDVPVRKKILIGDSQEATAVLVKMVLGETRYHTHTACSGLQIVDRILTDRPDLLILDLDSLGQSGSELLGWLRYRRDFSDIPVLLLVGRKTAADGCFSHTEEQLVPKPIDRDVLKRRVQEILGEED